VFFFSSLQCVSVQCSALQCVAVRCCALQYVSIRLAIQLQKWEPCTNSQNSDIQSLYMQSCDAACGSMLQFVAVHCSVLMYVICSHVMQCVAVCCSALQCIAVRCSALQSVAVFNHILYTVI